MNDLRNYLDSEAYMFADDTKVFKVIKNERDIEIQQNDLDKLSNWSAKWFLMFHPDKCVAIWKSARQSIQTTNMNWTLAVIDTI